MTVPLRILSIAPRYRPGIDGAAGGHYSIYQDDLRAAGARLGISVTTLAERGVPSADGVLGALDVTSPDTIARSVAAAAEPFDHVMVYEGSLAMVAAFTPVALARPDLRIVVNLFHPEPGLVPTTRPGPAKRVVRGTGRVALDRPPANLVISAETEIRADLARRIGIPCAGAWRLHSTLWDIAIDPGPRATPMTGTDPAGTPLRVLVPLADRGYTADVVRDVATVLRLLRAHPRGAQVLLTLTGATSTKQSARVRGPRLEQLGARRIEGPADRHEYAALFRAHDVVWIPNRTSYRSQSSGKALDALVVGRPVLGFAGGWPAREAARWLGETLDYRDAHGAARLLVELQERIEELHGRLATQEARIRAAYAPESTLARFLELLGSVSPDLDKDLPTPPAPLPTPLQPTGRPRASVHGAQAPLNARILARIAGLRAVFIGPGPRIEGRARRLLAAVSIRLHSFWTYRSGR